MTALRGTEQAAAFCPPPPGPMHRRPPPGVIVENTFTSISAMVDVLWVEYVKLGGFFKVEFLIFKKFTV